MNVILTILLICSIVFAFHSGIDSVVSGMLNGATAAVTLLIKLIAIYSLWLGMLKIMQKGGFCKVFYFFTRPIAKFVFKGESDNTIDLIAMNLAANALGLGSAGSALAIKAINNMNVSNEIAASDNMLMLFIINATSIQIIPSTVISMRYAAGSVTATDIFLPTLLSTSITSLIGITLAVVLRKIKGTKLIRIEADE